MLGPVRARAGPVRGMTGPVRAQEEQSEHDMAREDQAWPVRGGVPGPGRVTQGHARGVRKG